MTAAWVLGLLEPGPQIAELIQCRVQGRALLVDDGLHHIDYSPRPFTHGPFNEAHTVGLAV